MKGRRVNFTVLLWFLLISQPQILHGVEPVSADNAPVATEESSGLPLKTLSKPQAEYVHHIVLVELKPEVTDEQKKEIVDEALHQLSDIPVVEEVHVGEKLLESREVHIKNYDIAIYIRLLDPESISVYRAHENHRRFVNNNRDKFAWIQVVDFLGKSKIDFSSKISPVVVGDEASVDEPEPTATLIDSQ